MRHLRSLSLVGDRLLLSEGTRHDVRCRLRLVKVILPLRLARVRGGPWPERVGRRAPRAVAGVDVLALLIGPQAPVDARLGRVLTRRSDLLTIDFGEIRSEAIIEARGLRLLRPLDVWSEFGGAPLEAVAADAPGRVDNAAAKPGVVLELSVAILFLLEREHVSNCGRFHRFWWRLPFDILLYFGIEIGLCLLGDDIVRATTCHREPPTALAASARLVHIEFLDTIIRLDAIAVIGLAAVEISLVGPAWHIGLNTALNGSPRSARVVLRSHRQVTHRG